VVVARTKEEFIEKCNCTYLVLTAEYFSFTGGDSYRNVYECTCTNVVYENDEKSVSRICGMGKVER
jgi:hypothetical protein